MGDGLLHIHECPLRRCGYVATGPGNCPYDHGEDVRLVPLTALVLCADCGDLVVHDMYRAPDGRQVCASCAIGHMIERRQRGDA